jgi:homoaconitate hydratase
MVENGFVHPGSLVVASDSHSNMYGALAAVGTPVVRTDAAAIWATGRTWWQVPRTVKVVLEGRLRAGVVGKDVILALCGLYSADEVLNAAVEFHGPGIDSLSISERMTIANMTTEWGALVGWFPFDETTALYLRQRAGALASRGIPDRLTEADDRGLARQPAAARPDADYAAEITLDLAAVSPQVTGPTRCRSRGQWRRCGQRIAVDKAYLLLRQLAHGRLAEAAEVLRGRGSPSCRARRRGVGRGPGRGRGQGRLAGAARRRRAPPPARLRRLHRARRRPARAGRGRDLRHQPQLQGPHGLARREGVPGEPRGGRGVGGGRPHHRATRSR